MRRFSRRGLLRYFVKSPSVASLVLLQQYRLCHHTHTTSISPAGGGVASPVALDSASPQIAPIASTPVVPAWTSPEQFAKLIAPGTELCGAGEDMFQCFDLSANSIHSFEQINTISNISLALAPLAHTHGIVMNEKNDNVLGRKFYILTRDNTTVTAPTAEGSLSSVDAPPSNTYQCAIVGYVGCVNQKEIVIQLRYQLSMKDNTTKLLHQLRAKNIEVNTDGYFRITVPNDSLSAEDTKMALRDVCLAIPFANVPQLDANSTNALPWTSSEEFEKLLKPGTETLSVDDEKFRGFQLGDDSMDETMNDIRLALEKIHTERGIDILKKRGYGRKLYILTRPVVAVTSGDTSGDTTSPESTATPQRTIVGYIGCVKKKDIVIQIRCNVANYRLSANLIAALKSTKIDLSIKGTDCCLLIPPESLDDSTINNTKIAIHAACDAILRQGNGGMWKELRSHFFTERQIYHGLPFRKIKSSDSIKVRPEPSSIVDLDRSKELSFQTQQGPPRDSLKELKKNDTILKSGKEVQRNPRGFMFPGPSGCGKSFAALALIKHLSRHLLSCEIPYENCFGIYVNAANYTVGVQLTTKRIIKACVDRLLEVLPIALQYIPDDKLDLNSEWKKYLAMFYFVIDEMGSHRDVVRELVQNEFEFGEMIYEELCNTERFQDSRYAFIKRQVKPGAESLDVVQFAYAIVGTGVGASNSDGSNSLNDTYVTVRTVEKIPQAVFLQTLFAKKGLSVSAEAIDAMIEYGVTVEGPKPAVGASERSKDRNASTENHEKYVTINNYCGGGVPQNPAIHQKTKEEHKEDQSQKEDQSENEDQNEKDILKKKEDEYEQFVNTMLFYDAVTKEEVSAALLTNARCATMYAILLADVNTLFSYFTEEGLMQLFIQISLKVADWYVLHNGWGKLHKYSPSEVSMLRCYLISLAHTQPLGFHLLPHAVQKQLCEDVGAIEDVLTYRKPIDDHRNELNDAFSSDTASILLGPRDKRYKEVAENVLPFGFVLCTDKTERFVNEETNYLTAWRRAQSTAKPALKERGRGTNDETLMHPQYDQLDCSLFPKRRMPHQVPILKEGNAVGPERVRATLRWELNSGVEMVALLQSSGIEPSELYKMRPSEFYERLYATKTLMVVNAFHYSFIAIMKMRAEDRMVERRVSAVEMIESFGRIPKKPLSKLETLVYQLPLALVDTAVPLENSPMLTLRGHPRERKLLEPEAKGHYEHSTLEHMTKRIEEIVTQKKQMGTVLEFAGNGTPRSDTMIYSDGVMHQLENKNYAKGSCLPVEKLMKRVGQTGYCQMLMQSKSRHPILLKSPIVTNRSTISYKVTPEYVGMFPVAGISLVRSSLVNPLYHSFKEQFANYNETKPYALKFSVAWFNDKSGRMDKGFRASISNAGLIRHCILEKKLRINPTTPCQQSITIVSPHPVLPKDADIRFRNYRQIVDVDNAIRVLTTVGDHQKSLAQPTKDGEIGKDDKIANYNKGRDERSISFSGFVRDEKGAVHEARVYNNTWSLSSFLKACCRKVIDPKVQATPLSPPLTDTQHVEKTGLQGVDFVLFDQLTMDATMSLKLWTDGVELPSSSVAVKCNVCTSETHSAKNCPRCPKCLCLDHKLKDCRGVFCFYDQKKSPRTTGKTCDYCGQMGHIENYCAKFFNDERKKICDRFNNEKNKRNEQTDHF